MLLLYFVRAGEKKKKRGSEEKRGEKKPQFHSSQYLLEGEKKEDALYVLLSRGRNEEGKKKTCVGLFADMTGKMKISRADNKDRKEKKQLPAALFPGASSAAKKRKKKRV